MNYISQCRQCRNTLENSFRLRPIVNICSNETLHIGSLQLKSGGLAGMSLIFTSYGLNHKNVTIYLCVWLMQYYVQSCVIPEYVFVSCQDISNTYSLSYNMYRSVSNITSRLPSLSYCLLLSLSDWNL